MPTAGERPVADVRAGVNHRAGEMAPARAKAPRLRLCEYPIFCSSWQYRGGKRSARMAVSGDKLLAMIYVALRCGALPCLARKDRCPGSMPARSAQDCDVGDFERCEKVWHDLGARVLG